LDGTHFIKCGRKEVVRYLVPTLQERVRQMHASSKLLKCHCPQPAIYYGRSPVCPVSHRNTTSSTLGQDVVL